jgi:hypothetical protein
MGVEEVEDGLTAARRTLACPWVPIWVKIPSMFRALRSRRLAFVALAAFLLAQPAVGCAALCLFQVHDAGAHAMPDMDQGRGTLANVACHTGISGAVQRASLQLLSPMAPTRAAVVATVAEQWVEPVGALPELPRLVSHAVESPPPRFV